MSDRTYESLGQVLRCAVTPWQVTSLFPGLSLHNLSIRLDIGVIFGVVHRQLELGLDMSENRAKMSKQ